MERIKKETLQKAREGDMPSFEKIFMNLRSNLKSYLFRLTPNNQDIDDILQDVFIKAYNNIQTFRGDSSFKTWVFTIATNHTRNILKKTNPLGS